MFRTVLLCTALALPRLAFAQSHPIVGQWNVSMESPVPPGNGAALTVNRKGVLSVAQAGDSLVATLTFEPMPGTPSPKTDRLVAAHRAGKVSFAKTAEASLGGNGDVLARTANITYDFEVTEQRLVGAMSIRIDGIPDIPARPIIGTRVK